MQMRIKLRSIPYVLIIALLCELLLASLNSGEQVTRGRIGEIDPSPSPDGKWLAFRFFSDSFKEKGELRLASREGSARNLVPGDRFEGGVSWSPDGDWISYTERVPSPSPNAIQIQLFKLNPQTGRRVQLTSGHRLAVGEWTSWSRNGEIAFVCADHKICVIGAAGGPLRIAGDAHTADPQITPQQLAWSPDGSRIAFSVEMVGNSHGSAPLWLLDARSGAISRLTEGAWDGWPTWIDNESLVFSRANSQSDLWHLARLNLPRREVLHLAQGGRLGCALLLPGFWLSVRGLGTKAGSSRAGFQFFSWVSHRPL